MAETPQKVDSK